MKFHHSTQARPPGHHEYSPGAVGYILEYILEYIYSTFYLSHSDAVSQQLFGPPTSHPSACVLHQANNSFSQLRLDPCPGPQNPKKPERQQRLLHTGTHTQRLRGPPHRIFYFSPIFSFFATPHTTHLFPPPVACHQHRHAPAPALDTLPPVRPRQHKHTHTHTRIHEQRANSEPSHTSNTHTASYCRRSTTGTLL